MATLHEGLMALGNYHVVRELGHARLSTYLLAVHQLRRTTHIIRSVNKGVLEESSAVRDMFYNELAALRSHDHPSMVRLTEILEDDEFAYVVTSFVSGRPVIDVLYKRRMNDTAKARTAFHQLVNIALFLERRGIPHMFRLENVLQSFEQKLVLVDISPPCDNGSELDLYRRLSTQPLFYRAPELLDESKYTASGNAWTCGIALLLLLSGELPFNVTGSHRQLRERIKKMVLTLPLWIPMDARHLISALLENRVSARMALSAIPQHSWFAAGILEHEEGSIFWDSPSINCSLLTRSVGDTRTFAHTVRLPRVPTPSPNTKRSYEMESTAPADLGMNVGPGGGHRKRRHEAQGQYRTILPSALGATRLTEGSSHMARQARGEQDEELMREAQQIMREEAMTNLLLRPRSFSSRSDSTLASWSQEPARQRPRLGRMRFGAENMRGREPRTRRWTLRVRTPFFFQRHDD